MQNFSELHLKPGTLELYGLPDILYRVPASALLDDGELPLVVMLHGLQQRSRNGEAFSSYVKGKEPLFVLSRHQ